MQYIQGPDFPTGGIVVNKDELLSIYENGEPERLSCAEKWKSKKAKRARNLLVITEIPYTMIGANIGKFLNDVAGLVESKKTTGYCRYLKPVLKRGNPYCIGTQKRYRY